MNNEVKIDSYSSVSYGWSPSHITGFFYPCGCGEPLLCSSLGAGVNLSKGVKTKVESYDSDFDKYEIFINGKKKSASVSEFVVKKFLDLKVKHTYKLCIYHYIDLPVGAGFGTSGAGALSLSLALRRLLKVDIDDIECYRIAHCAEVENKTGLGTVMAEIGGGIEVRIECGGPGIGKVENIFFDNREKVIVLFLGEYSTPRALSDKTLLEKVTKYGKECLEDITKSPSVENFMELSRWFIYKTGIVEEKIKTIIDSMDRKGVICSMPLFGKSVFCIDSRIDFVLHSLKEYGKVIISDISNKGVEERKR